MCKRLARQAISSSGRNRTPCDSSFSLFELESSKISSTTQKLIIAISIRLLHVFSKLACFHSKLEKNQPSAIFTRTIRQPNNRIKLFKFENLRLSYALTITSACWLDKSLPCLKEHG